MIGVDRPRNGARQLRERVAKLYPDTDHLRKLLRDAGFKLERFKFSEAHDINCFNALEEVERQLGPVGIRRIKAIVRMDHPGRGTTPGAARQAIQKYLEWARRSEIGTVPIPGFSGVRLPLDQLFVELKVRERHAVPWGGALPLLQPVDDARAVVGAGGAADLQSIIRETKERGRSGVVLLGYPGAGKTTLLKYLFRAAANGETESLSLPAGLVPVFLRIAQIDPKEDLRAHSLERVMVRQIGAEGHPEAGFALAGRPERILFLLDGLDEVRDEETRARVCAWINREVELLPNSYFVATCRVAAWRREAVLDNQFIAADVLSLRPEAIGPFVQRWYRAVYANQGQTQAAADSRAERLVSMLLRTEHQASQRIRDMTRNPLLLSTICLNDYAGRALPRQPAELYERCVSLLLEGWSKRRNKANAALSTQARQLLQRTAWAMHQQQKTQISRADLGGLVDPIVGAPGWPGAAQGAPPSEGFLAFVREECGVLIGSEEERFQFLHLSFQEYLAAAQAAATGGGAELAAHVGEPFWKETILLSMTMPGVFVSFMEAIAKRGMLAKNRELLTECCEEVQVRNSNVDLSSVCAAIVANEGTQSDAAQVAEIRAGLELFRGRWLRGVESWAASLTDHSDPFVSALARRVADVAESTAEGSETLPPPLLGLEWVHVPAGTFTMGSDIFDPVAHQDEMPAHLVKITSDFLIARHPVTNANYGLFLVAEKYPEPFFWGDRRFNRNNQPVVGVSLKDAVEFCRWVSKQLPSGWVADLPTEAEWEYAARGSDGRRYPWGNEAPRPERAVYGEEKPESVGGRPAGASPFGCEDMAGSVWEWCLDAWMPRYETTGSVAVDPLHQGNDGMDRVARGGAWCSRPGSMRAAARFKAPADEKSGMTGFRLVCRRSGV